jgi:hypothetical protein
MKDIVWQLHKRNQTFCYAVILIQTLFSVLCPNSKYLIINDFEKFQTLAQGYFRVITTQEPSEAKFATISNNGAVQRILYGVFITKFAESILNCNQILFFVAETTFRLFPHYVTAFLYAVYKNCGIPIAFSFGQSETKKLYSMLFDALETFLHINLSQKNLLSDQGSALKAIAKQKQMKHFYCLRHAIKSLGKAPFAFETIELLKCKTGNEFNCLKTVFERNFNSMITTQQDFENINHTFKKVGLGLINGNITIILQSKWEKFSLIYRVTESVATTSNCLESFHGHENQKIPRNNKFWKSLYRTILSLEYKTVNAPFQVHHDVLGILRRLRYKATMLTEDEYLQESNFFETNHENQSCKCTDNLIINQLYGQSFPCHHLIRNFQANPEIAIERLNISRSTRNLITIIDEKPVKTNKNTKAKLSRRMEKIIRPIIFYTSKKHEDEIREKINQHFSEAVEYVNGYPVEMLMWILQIIYELTNG